MKFLHLADLHIGRRLNERSLLDDQRHILDRIVLIAGEERPDAVLIAGDLYDKPVPPAEAVALCDRFLVGLTATGAQVFLIAGNHDSPERLAFGNRLLEKSRIHISPVYTGEIQPVTLSDEYGDVHFWLLPFLKPGQVRHCFPEETVESYTDACRVAVAHMGFDKSRRNVLLAHQFVTGAATCESEELSVGGTDNVDVTVFEDFDYTALGHLHGPQNVGSNRVRYCGTPLKYSFSEANQHKSVTLVELGEKGHLHVELIPLTPRHDLRELRGSFAALTDRANYENTPTDDYLHILLTDEEDVPEAAGRLRAIYPNLLQLSYDNTRTRTSQLVDGPGEVPNRLPLELFDELYQKQNNQPMSPVQRAFMQTLMESIGERSV